MRSSILECDKDFTVTGRAWFGAKSLSDKSLLSDGSTTGTQTMCDIVMAFMSFSDASNMAFSVLAVSILRRLSHNQLWDDLMLKPTI